MPEFLNPAAAISGLRDFLETGGSVLVWIMAATFVMWAFIVERLMYWRFTHDGVVRDAERRWKDVRARYDMSRKEDNRRAHWIREKLISEVRQKAEQNVEFVKTMVGIAPLLGLLGTVTGMVEVFDVMAITGSSNARAMSAGVSKATIPTMAGMVAALSGLALSSYIERMAKQKVQQLGDHLDF